MILTHTFRQWFLQTYIPKQTIPVLRSFGDSIQTATGIWLGLKSQEKKANLIAKSVSFPYSRIYLPLYRLTS